MTRFWGLGTPNALALSSNPSETLTACCYNSTQVHHNRRMSYARVREYFAHIRTRRNGSEIPAQVVVTRAGVA